jgi:hypothetical protein
MFADGIFVFLCFRDDRKQYAVFLVAAQQSVGWFSILAKLLDIILKRVAFGSVRDL